MSGNEDRLLDAAIRDAIRSMPEELPPAGLSARIMAGLEPKKTSLWTRFLLWLNGPKSVTFTPMQAAPVAVCVMALMALAYLQMMPASTIDDTLRLSTVRFVLGDEARNAQTVSVIGSFNDWKAERSVMWYDEEGRRWILEAKLPPGDHEYVFLVDGKRLVPDPGAAMTRDDGFGNRNSILFVNGGHEQAL